jgi:hypothetical protein
MSQEIDDLLEIDSNSEQTKIQKENNTKRFLIRYLTPLIALALGYYFGEITNGSMNDAFGAFIFFGGFILLWLLFLFIEMIVCFANKKNQLAIVNLKVFGLLIISGIIFGKLIILYEQIS